ncbi:MAG: glutamate synthase-related protein [Thermodesulfobacteriota bacterium]
MPAKYMIHTRPVRPRFKPVTKSGIIAWEEGCLKCAVCVKKRCVYKVYEHRGLDARQMVDSIDNECMSCLRCVQGCPNELIHKSVNPEYRALGDYYWTPEIVAKLWQQAETGKIPVSGAGYPGPFSGPGFDAMWTDMSEIVRPTRDGIHGREYISTAIDLGRTPRHLEFTPAGELKGGRPQPVDIPLPVLLRVPPFGSTSRKTLEGWARAARHLGTFLALGEAGRGVGLGEYGPWVIPDCSPAMARRAKAGKGPRLVEVPWEEGVEEQFKGIRWTSQKPLVSVRLPAVNGVEEKVVFLAKAGFPILHLAAPVNGRSSGDDTLFIKDRVRKVHQALVEAGVRDEVTLLASGGIALAEHVAKTILCGADGVLVDLPILIALECRVCRRCTQGQSCPVEIEEAPSSWVAGRVVNLMGAWHNQLLEVMGAMGIRDVRRLRGETGRAMFFEDLDMAAFQDLGKAQEGWDLE